MSVRHSRINHAAIQSAQSLWGELTIDLTDLSVSYCGRSDAVSSVGSVGSIGSTPTRGRAGEGVG